MDDSLKDTEWWWIDYLEGELDLILEHDLELLLQHSEEDRDSFENFRLLKQWVRESDPAQDLLGVDADVAARLDRLRSGVMAAVSLSEPDLKPRGERVWDVTP